MTQVRMYVGVADRLALLYKLLSRQILPRGLRAFIHTADDAEAERVDKYLWTAVPGEFLPHARFGTEAAAETPAVIGANEPPEEFYGGILLSWSADAPPFFGRFEMLADITEDRPATMRAARARYKMYQAHGYPIDLHKMGRNGG